MGDTQEEFKNLEVKNASKRHEPPAEAVAEYEKIYSVKDTPRRSVTVPKRRL